MSKANIQTMGNGFVIFQSRTGEQLAYEYSEDDFARIVAGADPANFQATRVQPEAAMLQILGNAAADVAEF